jgi:hypothetical protein
MRGENWLRCALCGKRHEVPFGDPPFSDLYQDADGVWDLCRDCGEMATGKRELVLEKAHWRWCDQCGEQGVPVGAKFCRLCGEEQIEPFRAGWDESD